MVLENSTNNMQSSVTLFYLVMWSASLLVVWWNTQNTAILLRQKKCVFKNFAQIKNIVLPQPNMPQSTYLVPGQILQTTVLECTVVDTTKLNYLVIIY